MMIKSYTPIAADYLPYDPESCRVAGIVAEYILSADRALKVEHIGSTAFQCWGKGIVDFLVVCEPDEILSARLTIEHLGFQNQGAVESFLDSGPVRVGSIEHLGRTYRLHTHVIVRNATDARDLLRFRDLLRENLLLRRAYEEKKRAILARGVTVESEYAKAKGQFIRLVLKNDGYDEA